MLIKSLIPLLLKSLTTPLIRTTFVSIWKTDNPGTSNDNQITLPFPSSAILNCKVRWGDNSSDIITAFDQAKVTHTYAVAGTKTVTITGTINGWRFNNTGDKEKIIEISKWGPLLLGNDGDYFSGALNLVITATDILDTSSMTSWLNIFLNCGSITTIPSINRWNSSNITNGNGAFSTMALFNQDLEGLNMSSLITAIGMFSNNPLFNGKFGSWKTPNLQNTTSMLEDAAAFNQPIGDLDMQSLLNTTAMFLNASAFNQPINWITPNLNNMRIMFLNASAFDQDLSGVDVSNVTDMLLMLSGTSFSRVNYDLLLVAWEALTLQSGVVFDAGTAQFSGGAPTTARADIITNFSWTITDGGQFLENPVTLDLALQITSFQDGKTKAELVTVGGGDEVSTQFDISGNNEDVTQATGTKQPIFTINAINGHEAIVYDNIDDLLKNASFIDFSTATIFAVAEMEAGDTSQAIFDINTGSTNTGLSLFYSSGQTKLRAIDSGGVKEALFAETLPSKHIFSGTVDGTNVKLYIDGDLKDTTLCGTLANTLTQLDVGQLANLDSFTLKGPIGEILLYPRALSDSERESVEEYLSDKFDVPLI